MEDGINLKANEFVSYTKFSSLASKMVRDRNRGGWWSGSEAMTHYDDHLMVKQQRYYALTYWIPREPMKVDQRCALRIDVIRAVNRLREDFPITLTQS